MTTLLLLNGFYFPISVASYDHHVEEGCRPEHELDQLEDGAVHKQDRFVNKRYEFF